jgi:hypothetical protein
VHEQRLRREVTSIKSLLTTSVNLSANPAYVIIHDVTFPDGWHPYKGDILLVIPENYPAAQPLAFIQKRMQYREEKVDHWMQRLTAPTSVPDHESWGRWCIEDLNWNPERHTINSMMELLMRSLQRPNHDQGWDREAG